MLMEYVDGAISAIGIIPQNRSVIRVFILCKLSEYVLCFMKIF